MGTYLLTLGLLSEGIFKKNFEILNLNIVCCNKIYDQPGSNVSEIIPG